MNDKINKSSTKEKILEALAEAEDEQELLHNEVESLQVIVDDLRKETTRKNNSITKLETLVQEEDIKKRGLIKQLASQSSDIELGKKTTEQLSNLTLKLGETEAELVLVKKELWQKKEDIKAFKNQITELEEELTKPEKQKSLRPNIEPLRWFYKTLTAIALVGVTIIVSYIVWSTWMVVGPKADDTSLPISFINYDNGIIAACHDSAGVTLKPKDGGDLEISGVDVSIAKWAKKAGFTGILYGRLIQWNGKVMLIGPDEYEIVRVDVDAIVSRFEELGCHDILALVENPDNIKLPPPFKYTSEGELKFYEARRKVAGFVPVVWGKDRRVLYISSDNVHGFISSNGIIMKIDDEKVSVSFEAPEKKEVSSLTKTISKKVKEVAGISFDQFGEWVGNNEKMLH